MRPSWLRQLYKKCFAGQRVTRRNRAALAAEALESRDVPTAVWTGLGLRPPTAGTYSALWTNPNNWDVLRAPIDGEDVVFPAGLPANQKPPATIVDGVFLFHNTNTAENPPTTWLPSGKAQANVAINGNFRIGNLVILDDNYHFDVPRNQQTGQPIAGSLTILGSIITNIPQPVGSLTGVSLIGPNRSLADPTTQPGLTLFLANPTTFIQADGPGVLYITASIVELAGIPNGAGFQKNGPGTIGFSGVNTFTGAVLVNEGTLLVGGSTALGDTIRGTTVNDGATLGISYGVVNESLNIQGNGAGGVGALAQMDDPLNIFSLVNGFPQAGPLTPFPPPPTWTGGITLQPSAAIGATGQLDISTTGISGDGNLSKVGPGTVTLTVANTYAGQTFVRAGTLQITDNNALSTFGSDATSTTVFNGGMLEVVGDLTINETLFLNGDGLPDNVGRPLGALHMINASPFFPSTAFWQGPVTLLSASSIGAATNGVGVEAELVITGVFAGASTAGLTKVDEGNLRFPVANPTFFGSVTVNHGTLELADAVAIGPSGTITVNSTTGTAAASGTLQLEGTYTLPKSLVLNGPGYQGNGAVHTVPPAGGGTTNIQILQPVTFGSPTSARTEGGTTLDISGSISGAASTAGINKTGLGQLIFRGDNSYTGSTTIREGTMLITSGTALGAPAGLGTRVFAGATLLLGDALNIVEDLVLSGSGADGNGALQAPAGNSSVTGDISTLGEVSTTQADIGVAAGGVLIVSGVISGDADLHKVGAGELQLVGSQNNTLLKSTFVDAGTLSLGKDPGVIALGGQVFVGDGIGGNNSDVLRYLASNQIPESVSGVPALGALTVSVAASGLVDLNGFNETYGGLTLTGAEVRTGTTGLLTLGSDVVVLGSTESSRIAGNVSLGGQTRVFSEQSLPGIQFFSTEDPVQFGSTFTLQVNVTGVVGGPTATGQVQFFTTFNGVRTPLGSAPVIGGVATLQVSSLAAGPHMIEATYTDNPDPAQAIYGTRTVALPTTLEVVGAPSRQFLSANRNPSDGTVSFTYTITRPTPPVGQPANVAPTGTVTFFADGNSIGTGTVNANGVATLTTGLPVGTYTITATYNGDTFYPATTTTLATTATPPALPAEQVVVDAPRVRLSSSANSSRLGQNVTFTFTAERNDPLDLSDPTPTGRVTFFFGAVGSETVIGPPTGVMLDANGMAAVSSTALPAGTQRVIAIYEGDEFYEPQTVTLLGGQIVLAANTARLVSTNLNPARPGEPVTFTFTTLNAAAGGFVTFRNNGTPLGAPVQVVNGVAMFTTSLLPLTTAANPLNITAQYTGDPGTGTAGGTETLAPVQVVASPFAVQLVSNANPSQVGQAVTFTFTGTLTDTSGVNPTGTVTFFDGTTQIGMPSPLTMGFGGVFTASVQTLALTFGSHQITAVYSGDANFQATTVTLAPQQSVINSPLVELDTSDPTVTTGQNVTFTFSATRAQTLNPVPTGTVNFFANGVQLNPAPISLTNFAGTGRATFTTSFATAGTNIITAVYSGDTFYQGQTVTLQPNQQVFTTLPPPDMTDLPSLDAMLEINGVINGGAGNGIIAAGAGLTTLNGVNTYSGTSSVVNGTLIVGVNNALPDTPVLVGPNSQLIINGVSDSVPSLSGSGTLNLNGAAAQLTVGTDNSSFAFGGPIVGTGTLQKVGTGTLQLTGASPTYTGKTIVAGGTVLVLANQSNAAVDVLSGGTLAGTSAGQTVGVLTVSAGGTVSPGNGGIGTLRVNAGTTGATFNGGTYLAELGNGLTFDQLAITGNLNAGTSNPTLALNTTALTLPVVGQMFTILSTTTGTINAAFRFNSATGATLNNGDTVVMSGRVFTVNYTANNITLTFNGLQVSGSLSASANPSAPGQNVVLTATFVPVNPADTAPVNGTVTFTDTTTGTVIAANVPLSGGTATAPFAFTMPLGAHTVTAVYTPAGGSPYQTQTATLTQTVNFPSTVTVTTSNGSINSGDSVTITATVTGTSGTPTGTVTFVNTTTGATLGTATLNGSGQASITTSNFNVGNNTIVATYNGSVTYRSSSTTLTQTVSQRPAFYTGAVVIGNFLVLQGNGVPGGVQVVAVPPGSSALFTDMNGDGVGDVVLILPNLIVILDGQTGNPQLLATDLTGDGFMDVLFFNPDGSTSLLNGRTGIRT